MNQPFHQPEREQPVNLDQLQFEELGYQPAIPLRLDTQEFAPVPRPHARRTGASADRELFRAQFQA